MDISQAENAFRRRTAGGPAVLVRHDLGAHPIITHFLQRLNVEPIIRSCVGTARQGRPDHAQTTAALIHNLLVSPGPLYRISTGLKGVESSALGMTEEEKASLNDDRVARALDTLASERGRGIWFRLALRVIKQFEVATDRMHFDTTSITFFGQYSQSVSDPKITPGYNKDHRPDLKQLLFGLTVAADGAVPLLHQVWSGNRTDDSVQCENVDRLRQMLGRDDFIYVADSKLCTMDNLAHIAGYGGKFVTVMPRTRKEDREFRNRLREKGIRWKKIHAINGTAESGDIYSSCKDGGRSQDGFRIIWIRSSAKAQLDARRREESVTEAVRELDVLSRKLNRGQYRKRKNILREISTILKRKGCIGFLSVKLQRKIQVTERRLRPGRPAHSDPVHLIRQSIWHLQTARDLRVLRLERRTDGVFPLITNLQKHSKKKVLLIYKYQPYIERRFSLIKTDLGIAPIYLKKPRRVIGLIHAYFIAIAVASLLEREVRRNMAKVGIQELCLLPEDRMTSTPTAPRILELFKNISWYEFQRGDEMIRFPIKLSILQSQLISLLGVPKELYS